MRGTSCCAQLRARRAALRHLRLACPGCRGSARLPIAADRGRRDLPVRAPFGLRRQPRSPQGLPPGPRAARAGPAASGTLPRPAVWRPTFEAPAGNGRSRVEHRRLRRSGGAGARRSAPPSARARSARPPPWPSQRFGSGSAPWPSQVLERPAGCPVRGQLHVRVACSRRHACWFHPLAPTGGWTRRTRVSSRHG